MSGHYFLPPEYRHIARLLAEQESMQRMLGASESMQRVIEAGEQMRRMSEPLRISSNTAYAALAAVPNYDQILGTTIRAVTSLQAGREHAALFESSTRTVASCLASMEETQRAATLARSLSPVMTLDGVLAKTYSIGVASNLASLDTALNSLTSLREAAAELGTFRTVIEIGAATAVISPELQSALKSLDQVTSGATAIWSGIAGDLDRLQSIPAPLREIPVLQVFEASRGIALVYSDDEDIVDARPPAGLLAAETASLPNQIGAINPLLVKSYLGVLGAFNGRGADYVAHCSVSGRRLLESTVEELAPDKDVLAHNPQAERGPDGKITRRAKLRYIMRGLASSSKDYVKMTEGLINLILGTWYPMNDGVHKLDSDLGHEHLRSLICQIEWALVTLLQAHELTARN